MSTQQVTTMKIMGRTCLAGFSWTCGTLPGLIRFSA